MATAGWQRSRSSMKMTSGIPVCFFRAAVTTSSKRDLSRAY